MSSQTSPPLKLRVSGPFAVFTQPAFKVERLSYPVMTPSAARGILEAVLWKPAIRWRVRRIDVLNPIRFTAFRRNELNRRAVPPSGETMRGGGEIQPCFIEDDRAQRNTVALRDVDYLIEAEFRLTDRAGVDDSMNKFVEMFQRRVQKGQCFHRPYLGCREFAADVEPPEGAPVPIDDTRDLGIMLWDIEFGPDGNRPRFFRAKLVRGSLHVPADPEATLAGVSP